MKNELIYYYNLNPKNIYYSKNIYKFIINNEFFYLVELRRETNIDKLYNISIELNNRGIYTHKFIFNNSNSLITIINNKNYVLIKSNKEYNEKVTLNDLIYFSNITTINNNKKNNWYKLWCEKNDYFEYQIDNLSKKYPNIKESFGYFKGIVETAICLLVNEHYDNYSLCICHNRISDNTTLFDLYNPLNFIIDVKVRDISEYFKSHIDFVDVYDHIVNYLMYNNLSEDEVKLFFVRMLYPSFYFDLCENIFFNNFDDNGIEKILDKTQKYEKTIKKIYAFIRQTYIFPDIEWLN